MTQIPPVPPQPSGGGKKWLIIILVIVGVVAFVCCGGIATCAYLAKRGVQAAGNSAEAQLKELERQIQADAAKVEADRKKAEEETRTTVTPTETPKGETAKAETPKIEPAKGWPSDIPQYAGLSTVFSANEAKTNTITGQTKDSSEAVQKFYKSALESRGWTLEANVNFNNMVNNTYKKGDRSFVVQTMSDKGTTTVNLVHTVD